MSVEDKLQSIKQTVGFEYTKPDAGLVEKYTTALAENKKALAYLKETRGFDDKTIEHFSLGYNKSYDAISIPIYKKGELVNIKYRVINPTQAKYISTTGAETWIFNEAGAHSGKKKGRILITEGEFDAMMCWQHGFESVVSPTHGRDSFGLWLELLDPIGEIYIAYDNDKAGQESSVKLSQRIGEEKCLLVSYPDGFKDANEFFLKKTTQDFQQLIRKAQPFYKHKFKSLGDVITSLRSDTSQVIETSYLPDVKLREGWLVMISGRSNVGKTSFVLNIANELASSGIPTLVLPFERGIESVGERFLHVMANKSPEDFSHTTDLEWDDMTRKVADLDLYFALPNREDTMDLIAQSKRILNTRVVIIDHLDYMIRSVRGNREEAISNTLQNLKRMAEDAGVVLLIVTHVRKVDGAGRTAQITRPGIEDMKGSSSLYQDPEAVIMLSETENENEILVDVVKNKGEMNQKRFEFIRATGQFNSKYKIKEEETTSNMWDPNDPVWKDK